MTTLIHSLLFFGTICLTVTVGCGLYDRIRPLDDDEWETFTTELEEGNVKT